MTQWISNLQLLSHQSAYCVPIFWTLAYFSFCKRSLPRCHLTYLLVVLPAFWIVILVNFGHEIWKVNLSLERRHVSSDLFLHYDRFFYYFLISWCSMYSGADNDINARIKYFSESISDSTYRSACWRFPEGIWKKSTTLKHPIYKGIE